jgi:O-methyltransferase domain
VVVSTKGELKVSLCKGRLRGIFNPVQYDFDETLRLRVAPVRSRFQLPINANTLPAARTLLEKYDLSSVKTLVDVGSRGGGVAITITKACPHIKALRLTCRR